MPVEWDERRPILREIHSRLFAFALQCDSHPVRATNAVVATLKQIAKNPEDFMVNAEAYDPEASGALLVAYTRLSPAHKIATIDFWRGAGTLDPNEVKTAAQNAAVGFKAWRAEQRGKKKKGSGAPFNHLLREFASVAADLFRMAGGTPTAADPFRKFVDLLRMPVLDVAMAAGCALTPGSIIRLAAKERGELVSRTAKRSRKPT